MVAMMIKFVCSSCGERLSVPDQYAGRKGACPGCGRVNRVPLRGYLETQSSAVPTARNELTVAKSSNGNGNGAAVATAASIADRRGRIETATPRIEPPVSRVKHLVEPPGSPLPGRDLEDRKPANGNGHAYVHPLAEAVAAPIADPFVAAAITESENSMEAAASRGHGVLAPDELTPGERWKRAWEEPKPGWKQTIFRSVGRKELAEPRHNAGDFAGP